MKFKYIITVSRTTSKFLDIEVETESFGEASKIALDKSGDLDFSQGHSSDAEYRVENMRKLP